MRCSYRLADLRAHKDNILMKIKHLCESYGFNASTRSNLIGHKKGVHRDQYTMATHKGNNNYQMPGLFVGTKPS